MDLPTGAAISDADLAERFLAGDIRAFEALVTRYSRPIFNFVFRMLGDADEAADVAQTVFIQVHTSLPGARLDLPLRPWIYQIARNKSLDQIRKRRGVTFSDLERETGEDEVSPLERIADQSPLPDEVFARRDLQRALAAAILQLQPRSRAVVTLRYVNGLTFAEIGQALEMPENTAKTLFQRAKAVLRRALEDEI